MDKFSRVKEAYKDGGGKMSESETRMDLYSGSGNWASLRILNECRGERRGMLSGRWTIEQEAIRPKCFPRSIEEERNR